jgi:hypothetical protein
MTAFTGKWRNLAAHYRTLTQDSDDYRKAAKLIEEIMDDYDQELARFMADTLSRMDRNNPEF